MADFDNGLPPVGTTTDANISNIGINVTPYEELSHSQVKSVQIITSEILSDVGAFQVKSVLVDKEETGQNYFTML